MRSYQLQPLTNEDTQGRWDRHKFKASSPKKIKQHSAPSPPPPSLPPPSASASDFNYYY